LEPGLCQIELDSNLGQAEYSGAVARAVEQATSTASGDEALVGGQLDEARNRFLLALESAPRQKELVLLVAEIDMLLGRVEAALGMISEAMPVLTSSSVGARVLMLRNEWDTAKEVLGLAASEERYAPLASLLQLERARCETDGVERRLILDAAVASCPTLEAVRWARLEARAEFGDASGVLADAQHLEACTTGRQSRHRICRRAASVALSAGLEQQALALFQRALRYAPEDVEVMLGLARALDALGEGLRAIPLLERAVAIADESSVGRGAALVELARLVATKLNDLPLAVARLRSVSSSDPIAVEARGLEGRYRFMLGDVVGASVAFGKMRELSELLPPDQKRAAWLTEAARFERDVLKDHATAERHLAVALRLAPHDGAIQGLYREVAAVLAARRTRTSS
jgi:tetratricopeptide (TPR) repeat protein